MSMESGRGLMVAMTVLTTMMMSGTASGVLIKVGQNPNNGWAPGPINLTEWASHRTFYAGYWIGFWFPDNKLQYDVLRVNQTSYENCVDQGYIYKVSRGTGRDVYQLNDTTTYYFISSGGYCWGGLKIAVNVLPAPTPATAPVPGKSSASPGSNAGAQMLLLPIFFCIVAAMSKFYF